MPIHPALTARDRGTSPRRAVSRGIRLVAAAGLLAIASSTMIGAVGASADPRLGSYRTYVGVGSAATAGLWDGLTNGRPDIENSRVIAPTIASYDTAGSDRISTRAGGPLFARPWTAYDGAYALSASNHAPYLHDATRFWEQGIPRADIRGQIDFSRETRIDPQHPGTALTYLPFVRDAISVVGRGLDPDLTNLTRAELTSIFTCTAGGNIRVVGTGPATRVWYDNGTTVNQQLNPKVPQGSGDTRDFFHKAVGFSGTSWCVNVEDPYPNEPEENDGRELRRTGDIIPFLVSAWIAQKHLEVPTTVATGPLRILSTNGSAPVVANNASLLPGPLYGRSAVAPVPGRGVFSRDVYNTIDSSDVGTPLEAALTTGLDSGVVRYAVNRFGFKNLDYLGERTSYKTGGYHN